MTLAHSDLWNNTCPHDFYNSMLNPVVLAYGTDSEDLTIYYGCSNLSSAIPPTNRYHCTINGNLSNDAYFLTGSVPTNLILRIVDCSFGLREKIFKMETSEVSNNRSMLIKVLMAGFSVNYGCADCLVSGKQCGFDKDASQPICLYNNHSCPPPPDAKYDHFNVEEILRNFGSMAPKRYTYSNVKKLTNSFKYKVGQGGYGVVFKGELPDGHMVAVKVLGESKGNGEEFINEVASISRTSHVNIVTLLGFCYERTKRALIYEFVQNGSLDKFIHEKGSSITNCYLDSKTKFQIAVGIARGLEYLHRGCRTRILHFDIKPHNILLDENLCPKISDFGLAKLCKTKGISIVSMTGMRGTAGYIAPEVFSRYFGGVSHKFDVYSYGMLVLEMVAGRKNLDDGVLSHSSENYFPNWIYDKFEKGETDDTFGDITDDDQDNMIKRMIMVSLWCIQTNPSDRPSMSKVIEMLECNFQLPQFPPKPFLNSPTRSAQHDSSTGTTS
ncbi:hypothetical protein I3760_04G041500 [Carya illinoinensis]|nr:hypothetical protein I3760_04G041500 [Carya illinoinensis]